MFANRVSPEEKKEVQSVKLSSLASSSEGNCKYVGTKKTNVLVDCGVSAKRIENSLSELDLTVPEFDGILITHEHTDHIKGLGVSQDDMDFQSLQQERRSMRFLIIRTLGKLIKAFFIRLKQTNHLRSEI